ncbi:methyl-accepting chemotaxis protein [Lacrimispora defluvii]|uniref:HAMP domain-containing protein n=1 Tax=Lacrimispora defluvii TaxID=2719233 RepID=A0ABX1VXY5_9FIRM|nr:methyl-accepting chemotaxis protein [Lacrimispora defluvii]NNJ33191.1 HAMP domain-containing protein [Lacrimispora defluvii]
MKNLSISKKLIVGFGAILVMLLIAIGVAIFSISNINGQIQSYAKYTLPNSTSIWILRRNDVSIQRDISRALNETDSQKIAELFATAQTDCDTRMSELDKYAANQRDTSRDAHIAELRELWAESGKIRLQIAELMENPTEANVQKAKEMFDNNYVPVANQAAEILVGFTTTADARAVRQEQDATASVQFALVSLIVCGIVAVALSVLLTGIIRRSILAPVNEIVGAYGEISKGNMKTAINYQSRDELGQMAALIQKTNAMQSTIVGDVIDKFTKISHGDLRLRVDLDYPGDYAVLKQTIEDTVSTLNNTMLQINSAAEQVATGSDQVSSGAQALAAGSTEQAASVEELAATVDTIAKQAEENLTEVATAAKAIGQTGARVTDGNEHMNHLEQAMTEISSTSNQIASITKVIEDIAFQTNILALNAAIEAARAGNAGKGFAVVADEVRNLAAKSAEAAKQTSELIQSSVTAVEKGAEITQQTTKILRDVGTGAAEVTGSFRKIEQSITEQTVAIEQIKDGLSQISSVVQTNAATAEENSATSEEMSAQAVTLREEVGKFKLADKSAKSASGLPLLSASERNLENRLPESAFSLGKY